MADRLLEKHSYVLAGTRSNPASAEAAPVGFIEAMGMMLRGDYRYLFGGWLSFAKDLKTLNPPSP